MAKKKTTMKEEEFLEVPETPEITLDDPILEEPDLFVGEMDDVAESNDVEEISEPTSSTSKPVEPKEETSEPVEPEIHPQTNETTNTISFIPNWKFQKGNKVFTKKFPNQSFRVVKQFGWTTNLENIYYIKSNKTSVEAYILEEELSYTLIF